MKERCVVHACVHLSFSLFMLGGKSKPLVFNDCSDVCVCVCARVCVCVCV